MFIKRFNLNSIIPQLPIKSIFELFLIAFSCISWFNWGAPFQVVILSYIPNYWLPMKALNNLLVKIRLE